MNKTALLGALGALLASGYSTAADAQTCAPLRIVNSMVMEPVANDTLVTVPASFNGTTRQILVDTGKPFTQIGQSAITALKLPVTTNTQQLQELDVRSAIDPTAARDRVTVAAFGLGKLMGNQMQFQVSGDADLGSSTRPYDGYLGEDMFTLYDVDMDFGAGRLNYFAPDHCPGKVTYWPERPLTVVPMSLVDHQISVPVTVDGKTVTAIIDTGASHTVMRRGTAESDFDLTAGSPAMMPAGNLQDSDGEAVYTHTFSSLAFGGVSVANIPVLIEANPMVKLPGQNEPTLGHRAVIADLVPPLTIGMDVLRHLHVYIAYGEKNIYVTPAGTESVLFKAAAAPAK